MANLEANKLFFLRSKGLKTWSKFLDLNDHTMAIIEFLDDRMYSDTTLKVAAKPKKRNKKYDFIWAKNVTEDHLEFISKSLAPGGACFIMIERDLYEVFSMGILEAGLTHSVVGLARNYGFPGTKIILKCWK